MVAAVVAQHLVAVLHLVVLVVVLTQDLVPHLVVIAAAVIAVVVMMIVPRAQNVKNAVVMIHVLQAHVVQVLLLGVALKMIARVLLLDPEGKWDGWEMGINVIVC